MGPDLTVMGRLAPAAIAMAARSTVTQYVGVAKVKGGGSFPAMTGKTDASTVVLYDLSKTPPEKKEMAPADFTMGANDKWKHPPSQAKISNEQLADIVAYIKYAATGSKKTVSLDDVK